MKFPTYDKMAKNVAEKALDEYLYEGKTLREWVKEIQNTQTKTGHCKGCKFWKDSDGVYRRGIGAESSCPFNTKEIHDGNAYCYRFESQESEG